jgi:predicted phosphodiesterase
VAVARVAALYDIHAHLPALRAVLDEVDAEGIETLVIGGDVAAGPLPRETVQQLIELGPRCRFVQGNADREVVAAYDDPGHDSGDMPAAIATFAAARLTAAQRDWMAAFEPTVTLEIAGLGRALFCHGTPDSETAVITTATPEGRLREIVASVETDVVVCGHTHRQFDRRTDGVRVINAGAVGVPYEGRRGAFWAALGPDVQMRRTDYDHSAAMAELRAGGLEQLDEMLLESLIEPMDPDEVARLMEGTAPSA